MKKINVINLIKYYATKNDIGFKSEAQEIAKDFDNSGDTQLAEYIMGLLTDSNSFVPQINDNELTFLKKISINTDPLPLPEVIEKDIIGVINAISHNAGVNKFLFYGQPGTGKTETVKQISRVLDRELYIVDFTAIIDSKLGQTQKNINSLFDEINNCVNKDKLIILFDEIDALALDRTNSNDLREMGRATSTILKCLDSLDERIVIVATTNLYQHFDKALIRRFDAKINFDRYNIEDLQNISEQIFNFFATKFKFVGRNVRLLKKVVGLMNPILSPGELKNIIKSSIAFSSLNDEFDYLKRLYINLCNKQLNIKDLQKNNFTVREIEILTGISKSKVARELKEDNNENE